MAYRSYRKRPSRKMRRPKRRIYKRKSAKRVARIAKKTMFRLAEHKEIQTSSLGVNVFQAWASSTTPTTMNLLPNLAQGTDRSTRVGNRVRVTNAKLQLLIKLNPYNSVTNPYTGPTYVKIWIASYKPQNDITGYSFSNFLERDGDNPAAGYANLSGTLLDMMRNVNKTVWTVHTTRTIRLAPGGSSAGFPVANTYVYDAVAPSDKMITIPLTKYIGQLIYNDVSSVSSPNNKNLYAIWQACDLADSVGSFYPVQYDSCLTFKYIDI